MTMLTTSQLEAMKTYRVWLNKHPEIRLQLLKKLYRELRNNQDAIFRALQNDLQKCKAEALLSEYYPAMKALKQQQKYFRQWSRSIRKKVHLFNMPARAWLIPEPWGTVLIAGSWNYPLLLTLEPLFGAIAAGNTVILKLPEETPQVNDILRTILEKCFPGEHLRILVADWDELLKFQYDKIFFTGGTRLGKKIMAQAAEHLTPLTLELGGKCPALVGPDANVQVTAKRLVWAKFLNAGQTCVAPDFLVVHPSIKEPLVLAIRRYIKIFYGDDPQQSACYGRIINQHHYHRLCNLLQDGRLLCGGEKDPQQHYIAPTVLDNITLNSPIMQEEIFGPILPILSCETDNDVITLLQKFSSPLAVYYFGNNRKFQDRLIQEVPAGGIVVNDAVMQMLNANLPFGGRGNSGMGHYHGKYTFDCFVHYKSCMKKSFHFDICLRYPPFPRWKELFLRWITGY